MYDILIIGAGITGSLLARELARYQLSILVIEKENDVGNGVTNANSAIIHSGYDPLPGSLKAKLNVLGNAKYDLLSKELDVDFKRFGSLTIALNDEQLEVLNDLKKRSQDNGVEVSIISAEEVKKLEPNISNNVKGALLASSAGIIDPFNLTSHAMENAVDNGVTLVLDEEVISITNKDCYIVQTNKQIYESKIVINAAGLASDKIAKMVEDISWNITPRKGEYFVLDHYAPHLVNHVIFPLPSQKGKGVLVSATTSGNYIVGPSSELVDDIEDASTDKLTLDEVKKQATLMVPDIPFNQVIRVFAGLRPTSSRHDFIIETAKDQPCFINVAGIESPGLASAPAIADYVIDNFVKPIIELKPNPKFNPCVRPYIHINRLSIEERNKIIKENDNYGKMFCSCEHVTFGEVEDLFTRSVPPRTIKAIKKRTRAGFGKCQGGFCSPAVSFLLMKNLHIPPFMVKWDKDGSEVVKEVLKVIK